MGITEDLRKSMFGKPKGVLIKCSKCGRYYDSKEVQTYIEDDKKYYLCQKCSWKRKVRQSMRL